MQAYIFICSFIITNIVLEINLVHLKHKLYM